jgi:hypothetical protein
VRSKANKNNPLVFLNETVNGRIPLGWIMPMLAAFRANVKWGKPRGSFSWIVPIDDLLESCIDDLVLGILPHWLGTGRTTSARGCMVIWRARRATTMTTVRIT